MSWLYHRWVRWSFLFWVGVFAVLGLGNWVGTEGAARAVAPSTPGAIIVAQAPWAQSGVALTGSGAAIALDSATGPAVDAGLQSYQAGRYLDAIAYWQKMLTQAQDSRAKIILHSNLGQAYRQIGRLDQAIAQWDLAIRLYQDHGDQKQSDSASRQGIAKLKTEQAQAYSDLGQHQVAIERSQAAIVLAQATHDTQTEAAALGSLGNAYWSMGNYDGALDAHQQSLTLACQLNHQSYIATALNNLGNVFSSAADRFRYQANAANLEGDTPAEMALTQLAERDTQIALAAYQHSAEVSPSERGSTDAKALLNLNRLLKQLPANTPVPSLPQLSCGSLNLKALLNSPTLLVKTPSPSLSPQPAIAQNDAPILARLETEPDSQDKAYGYINLANNRLLGLRRAMSAQDFITLQDWLNQALRVARQVHDGRAESFALGTLGRIHEQAGRYEQAIAWTRQAQFVAQQVNAADSLYRWQWQIGRLLNTTGNVEAAIAAYEQAIATLQSIRGDIAIASKDLQFDFRDSVEPVYRELIGLLLNENAAINPAAAPVDSHLKALPQGGTVQSVANQPEDYPGAVSPVILQPSAVSLSALEATASSTPSSRRLQKVLDILELLKLAEIQNFFGDDCVQVAKDAVNAEQSLPPSSRSEPSYGLFDSTAAIVYSIVLSDRTYLILRSPNGNLKQYPVLLASANGPIPANLETLQTRIDRLRGLLEKRSTDEYLTESQSIYNALIRPIEADLAAAQPSTIVFINDGVLRKVPMAALHDGKQFLIEKYPIATTPSLSLTSRRPLDRANLRALIMGLTIEKPPFAALPNVGVEVKEVQKIVGGTDLVDQAFTLNGMRERLQTTHYSIIHMATHGKFGADAANTFLLDYSDRITIDKLDTVLRQRSNQPPIELLTLSACQTAAGDNRSALGIAGVAVRAGVKSAVATLWFINDQATVPLIEEFYTQLLKPGTSKAVALQRAQVKLINNSEYNHPAVWSPFILIGNWL